MKHRFPILGVLMSLVLMSVPAAATAATPSWAPAASAAIHPGVATRTADALCTSNFVFHDDSGNIYLGQAAHCSSPNDPSALDGCLNDSLPLGTQVRVNGATRPGELVYNSWIAMRERGEMDINTCLFNDFALIRLDPIDHARVNPTIPFWGGPEGIVPTSFEGADAFGYGTRIDRSGISTHAKRGVSLRQSAGGWTHVVDLDPPGITGDSGSGVIDGQGRAFGVLSTFTPSRGINGASDLSRMLAYATASGFSVLTLANGTESFRVTAPAPPPSQDLVGDLLRSLLG